MKRSTATDQLKVAALTWARSSSIDDLAALKNAALGLLDATTQWNAWQATPKHLRKRPFDD